MKERSEWRLASEKLFEGNHCVHPVDDLITKLA